MTNVDINHYLCQWYLCFNQQNHRGSLQNKGVEGDRQISLRKGNRIGSSRGEDRRGMGRCSGMGKEKGLSEGIHGKTEKFRPIWGEVWKL